MTKVQPAGVVCLHLCWFERRIEQDAEVFDMVPSESCFLRSVGAPQICRDQSSIAQRFLRVPDPNYRVPIL